MSKSRLKTVKVDEELFERFQGLPQYGQGHNAAMKALLDAYDVLNGTNKAVKGNSEDIKLSPKQKVRRLISILIEYNIEQYNGRKSKEPEYFFINGTRLFGREIGTNHVANVIPVFEEMQEQLNAHHDKYGITKACMLNPKFKESTGKGYSKKMVFIHDLLKQKELLGLFGRGE